MMSFETTELVKGLQVTQLSYGQGSLTPEELQALATAVQVFAYEYTPGPADDEKIVNLARLAMEKLNGWHMQPEVPE